jgi:DNA-binding transcriptional regulator YiaG
MESGVDFVACDNPHATRLTIHILAAVAEHEREMISARTKAALGAAKARGVKLGNPNLQPGNRAAAKKAREARSRKADAHAADVLDYIDAARRAGCRSLGEFAAALTARGVLTSSGGREWSRSQVSRIIARGNPMTPRELNRALGANIRRKREAAGMTIVAFAPLAGIPPSSLSRFERGERELSAARWLAIADALKVSPSSLLSRDDG